MSTCPRLILHDSLPVLENEEVEDESDEEPVSASNGRSLVRVALIEQHIILFMDVNQRAFFSFGIELYILY